MVRDRGIDFFSCMKREISKKIWYHLPLVSIKQDRKKYSPCELFKTVHNSNINILIIFHLNEGGGKPGNTLRKPTTMRRLRTFPLKNWKEAS